MEILPYLLWFVVAIAVLVTVHEYGHFWVARRLGVRVLRFSVGFGRPLLRRVGRDGVEYVVAAIPLGGYVKMLDEADGDVPRSQRHLAFNRQRLAVRTAVVVAGPAANFLFAVLAYWAMFVVGVPGLKPVIGSVEPASVAAAAGLAPGDEIVAVGERPTPTWQATVESVIGALLADRPLDLEVERDGGGRERVALPGERISVDDLGNGRFFRHLGLTPVRRAFPPVIGEVVDDSPALRAGLRAGDHVVALDGAPVETWGDLVEHVRARPDRDVRFAVRRGGERLGLTVRTGSVNEGGGRSFGRIGAIMAPPPAELLEAFDERYVAAGRHPPLDALGRAVERTADMTVLTLRMLWKMVSLEVSVRNLSGPISIAEYAGESAKRGLAWFLGFLGVVSISLGILNLLPIPLLDGGHLLYYCVELFSGRPVSEQVQALGQRLGVAMLVGLMGLAFYNDIDRIVDRVLG